MMKIFLLGSLSLIFAKDLSFYHNLDETNNSRLTDQAVACPKYICKTPELIFSQDTCVYLDESISTYYSQPCTNNALSCQSGPDGNSTCRSPPSIYSNAFPGEACQASTDCVEQSYGGCVNSICQGAPENSACVYNFQCNPGLTCNSTSNTCKPQLEIRETGCTSMTDCVNNAACNITNNIGTCYEIGSFMAHDFVSDCSLSNALTGSSRLCSSWTCAVFPMFNNRFRCLDLVTSAQDLPIKCTGSNDCTSNKDKLSGVQVPGDCECGYNTDGDSYCALFPGDNEYQSLIKQTNKWYQSKFIHLCNTAGRLNLLCMKTYWDSDNYNKYVYYSYLIQDYPFIQESPSCVLETMLWTYADAKKNYNAGGGESSDSCIIKLLFAIVFAFIAF